MSNLTNLVAEQFNELNSSYENQKKQTQEKFLHKQQECEGEHKETIAQLNIELKSNEAQLLNLIRKIEDKRGSMVTVEELASVLTLIADPTNSNSTLEDKSSSKSNKKETSAISKTKKATSTTSKEKTISKSTSKDISSENMSGEDTSMPKPAPKYKGKYYR